MAKIPPKKGVRMASVAATCINQEVVRELKARLGQIEGVVSLHFLRDDSDFAVFVGVSKYERAVRSAIYRVEDEVAEQFRDLRFDFHILAIPESRKVEEFISNAQLVFKHSAA